MGYVVAFALAVLTGCLSFDEVRCADGTICPVGSRCLNDQCVSPEQLVACDGHTDGDQCELLGGSGTCSDGICEPWICGDGKLNGLEQCDGDDFGPGGPVDCRDPRAGFYEPGTVKCSTLCLWDVSGCSGRCGDGVVNGPELCDSVAPADESCLDYGFDGGRVGCVQCGPALAGCTLFGWRHVSTSTLTAMNAIWGTTSDSFFVAGRSGTILRWNGATFETIDSKTSNDLYGVWGTSANDVFFVGDAGTILHFDGTKIDVMTSPTTENLRGVWGTGSTNVYAVGANGKILRFTGAWSLMTSNTTTNLNSIWGSGPSTIFAVGTGSTLTNTNVLRFDGLSWDASTPALTRADTTRADLQSVWGSAANDVFAATPFNEVFRFNGAGWTRMAAPAAGTPSALAGVTGGGGNDVFAVGPAVLHFDGTAWTKLVAPPAAGAARAVWRSPSGDVWLVGLNGFVARWGGAGWTTATSNTTNQLRGVAAVTPSDAWAVGAGTSTTPATILRYDGSSWTPQASSTPNNTLLTSVFATSPNFAIAVGTSGQIRHFDGTSWVTPSGLAGQNLFGVWAAAANDAVTVGLAGTARTWNGSTWTTSPAPPPSTTTLGAVWGTTSTNVFAVGQTNNTTPPNGVVYRFDGSWTNMPVPPTISLQGVWGAGASDVFAAGDAVLHFDGTWTQMTRGGKLLHAIAGTGPRNVFAVGDNATLLHYDGITWSPIRVFNANGQLATDHLRGVAATSRSVIVVGDNGFVQRLSFSLDAKETNCRDGWDNDGDANPDCADADCAGDPYCTGGGACAVTRVVKCGEVIAGSTAGRVSGRDFYRCSPNAESGGESIYRLDAALSGSITASLASTGNLDLIVVGSTPATSGCDPDFACLGASSTGNATEMVTFAATAGKSYYVTVESRDAAAAGTFTLSLTCP